MKRSLAATNPEIGTAAESISIQFFVPTAAAKLLDHTVIWPRAQAAGVRRHQWESSRRQSTSGETVITARRTLVPFLVEYWVELANAGLQDIDPLAIAKAVKAGLDALEPPGPNST